MQQHDLPHGSPVRLTPRPGSPETGVSAVESAEPAPRGVLKLLERAFAPDLVPESVMIGDKKVDTAQYIAEIAAIARHRSVRTLPDAVQSADGRQPAASRPMAIEQASSGDIGPPETKE